MLLSLITSHHHSWFRDSFSHIPIFYNGSMSIVSSLKLLASYSKLLFESPQLVRYGDSCL
jgi:hypothetical protein